MFSIFISGVRLFFHLFECRVFRLLFQGSRGTCPFHSVPLLVSGILPFFSAEDGSHVHLMQPLLLAIPLRRFAVKTGVVRLVWLRLFLIAEILISSTFCEQRLILRKHLP